MQLFFFNKLKKTYQQAQFEKKLQRVKDNFYSNIVQNIYWNPTDENILNQLGSYLAEVNKLISKYKMDEVRDDIVGHVEKSAKQYINNYIAKNINCLPTRDINKPLPFKI
ncbi:MAG: hypothetical protein JSR17_07010 [Proteobacteria bacterium]|nr:hypothetical protein [Pseudomonadota bacterium]